MTEDDFLAILTHYLSSFCQPHNKLTNLQIYRPNVNKYKLIHSYVTNHQYPVDTEKKYMTFPNVKWS
jgi:hypothetical protein